MSTFTKISDTIYALRFLRLLTTRWEDTNAFKYGIVDAEGNQLIKAKDVPPENKQYYTLFHRLVFNLKRLLQKVPFIGRSILTNYAAGFLMLREEFGLSEDELKSLMKEEMGESFKKMISEEGEEISPDSLYLKEGIVITTNKELICKESYEPLIKRGYQVKIIEEYGTIFNIPVYKGKCVQNDLEVLLTKSDCEFKIVMMDEETSGGPTVSTTSSGSSMDPSFPFSKKKKDRKYTTFEVDEDTYNRFVDPKHKYKHWKNYLDPANEQTANIRKCVNRGDLVVLRNPHGGTCVLRNYDRNKSQLNKYVELASKGLV